MIWHPIYFAYLVIRLNCIESLIFANQARRQSEQNRLFRNGAWIDSTENSLFSLSVHSGAAASVNRSESEYFDVFFTH